MRLLRGVVDTVKLIKAEPKRTMELLGRIYRENDPAFLARTTPRRRALMGDYEDAEWAFNGAGGAIPFDGES